VAAAPRVEQPITDADYLDNPKPEWPRLCRRLGERGRVVLRVLIGTDGKARSVQVKQSSGFPRLDEASVAAVQAGRYIPGKRGGVPEEMWVNIPFWWGEKDGENNP
jgi:protein TonB